MSVLKKYNLQKDDVNNYRILLNNSFYHFLARNHRWWYRDYKLNEIVLNWTLIILEIGISPSYPYLPSYLRWNQSTRVSKQRDLKLQSRSADHLGPRLAVGVWTGSAYYLARLMSHERRRRQTCAKRWGGGEARDLRVFFDALDGRQGL